MESKSSSQNFPEKQSQWWYVVSHWSEWCASYGSGSGGNGLAFHGGSRKSHKTKLEIGQPDNTSSDGWIASGCDNSFWDNNRAKGSNKCFGDNSFW